MDLLSNFGSVPARDFWATACFAVKLKHVAVLHFKLEPENFISYLTDMYLKLSSAESFNSPTKPPETDSLSISKAPKALEKCPSPPVSGKLPSNLKFN
jgi:hypothetical protein